MAICGGKDGGKEKKEPDMHKKFSSTDSTRKRTDLFCCLLFLAFLLAKMGVFVMMGATADYDALFNGMNHEGCSCGKTYNVCANETCSIVDEKGSADWDWEAWEKETTSPFEVLNPISLDWARFGEKSAKTVARGEVLKEALKRKLRSYTVKADLTVLCNTDYSAENKAAGATCKDCTTEEKDNCYIDSTWLKCKEESAGTFTLPKYATLAIDVKSFNPNELSVQCVAACPGEAKAGSTNNQTESDSPMNVYVYDAVKYAAPCEGDLTTGCGGGKMYDDITDVPTAEMTDPDTPTLFTPKGDQFGRYCAPDAETAPQIIRETYKQLKDSGGASAVGSIYQGSTGIMVAMIAAVVLGFAWLKLMEKCVGFLTWGAIFGILLSFVGAGLQMVIKAGTACDQPKYFPNCEVNNNTCTYAPDDCNANVNFATTSSGSYASLACGLFCLLFIACMYKRIKLAVGCMEEASRCIQEQPSMNFFPIFQFVLNFVFMIWWMAGSVNIAASGDIEPKSLFIGAMGNGVYVSGLAKTITFSPQQFYIAWFWLFGYFWVTQFIAALGEMVLAGCAAAWYFRELPDRPRVEKPLMSSFKRAVKYHIGSVAFGSLIIAIVKLIRAIVAYIQAKCNKAAGKAGAIGKMVKMVLCLIQSCLWCMEKCMKFINRNAYILIAIHGISFCTAAKRAFFLILRNILRIGSVALLSTIFLFLGKMFICGVPTFVAVYILVMNEPTAVEAPALPLFVTAVICYLIGSNMMAVYGMTIDTMLVCFVSDEEMHDNNPVYAAKGLSSFVNKKQAEAKAAGVKSDLED